MRAKSTNKLILFIGFFLFALMVGSVNAFGKPLMEEELFIKEVNLADCGIKKCTFNTNKMIIACFDKAQNKMLVEKV